MYLKKAIFLLSTGKKVLWNILEKYKLLFIFFCATIQNIHFLCQSNIHSVLRMIALTKFSEVRIAPVATHLLAAVCVCVSVCQSQCGLEINTENKFQQSWLQLFRYTFFFFIRKAFFYLCLSFLNIMVEISLRFSEYFS